MIKNKPLELYIHIPFCLRKCRYCDFLSGPQPLKVQKDYLEALKNEIRVRSPEYLEYRISSVFYGGGTPCVLPEGWISELMDMIRVYYQLDKDAEITIEINPGMTGLSKLKEYHCCGINRLSIGLQSALDQELELLGRVHTFAQFEETYRLARKVGFSNINIDIMGALPEQDIEDYRRTLGAVLNLVPPPEHISAYSLTLEESTPLWNDVSEGRLKLPDEDAEREMYWETDHYFRQNGYHKYEISNYARPGFECRHNLGYWQRVEYLGFGIGAASLIDNTRFVNIEDIDSYIANFLSMDNKKNLTLQDQNLTLQEQMEEFFFLGLRQTEGVSLRKFQDTFGCEAEEIYGDVIRQSMEDGLLEISKPHNIKLTERGLDVSNYCMARFIHPK